MRRTRHPGWRTITLSTVGVVTAVWFAGVATGAPAFWKGPSPYYGGGPGWDVLLLHRQNVTQDVAVSAQHTSSGQQQPASTPGSYVPSTGHASTGTGTGKSGKGSKKSKKSKKGSKGSSKGSKDTHKSKKSNPSKSKKSTKGFTKSSTPDGHDHDIDRLRHVLNAWLYYGKHKIQCSALIDTDGDGHGDKTLEEIITHVEAVALDPYATLQDMEDARALTTHVAHSPYCYLTP